MVQAAPEARARPAPGPAPAEIILPPLFTALAAGQGVRIGWLGNTGQGKTYAASWFVDLARARGLIDVVLVVDDKNGAPPWQGAARVNPADLAARPLADDEDPGAVVYRGAALDPARTVDVNEVAGQAWALAMMPGRPRVLMVTDELRRAVSPAGREWRAPAVARTLSEGRAVGVSLLWGTQSPQRIPVEAFDQSLLAIFHLGHRGRAYLERADLISGAVSLVIAGLAPRQFVLVDDAGDWDGRIYEIPLRREPAPATDGS